MPVRYHRDRGHGRPIRRRAVRLSGGEGVHVVYDPAPGRPSSVVDGFARVAGTFCWFGPVLGGPGLIDIMSLPKSIKLGYAVFAHHAAYAGTPFGHTRRSFSSGSSTASCAPTIGGA